MESEHIRINNAEERMDRVFDILEDYMFRAGIKGKNELRLTLLTEEALRLVKSVVSEKPVNMWLEGNAQITHIIITSEGKVTANDQAKLVSMSTTQENSAKTGFFGKILSAFSGKQEEATWSLTSYEAQVIQSRQKDAYSEEAWDDLERSLLANLASDIVVSVNNSGTRIVITKILSEALATVGSKKAKITSKQLILDNTPERVNEALEKADVYIAELELSRRDAIQMKLLLEESAGMLKEMSADYEAVIWFERYEHECSLRVAAKTVMDSEKKANLIDISTDGRNAAAKGVMAKIADVIESGMLGYDDVMRLQAKYGGGMVAYGGMGTYAAPSSMMATSEVFWSLNNYRNSLSDVVDEEDAAKEAWDELEKSIVASIAKDVVVGVKNNRVDITIVKEIA